MQNILDSLRQLLTYTSILTHAPNKKALETSAFSRADIITKCSLIKTYTKSQKGRANFQPGFSSNGKTREIGPISLAKLTFVA